MSDVLESSFIMLISLLLQNAPYSCKYWWCCWWSKHFLTLINYFASYFVQLYSGVYLKRTHRDLWMTMPLPFYKYHEHLLERSFRRQMRVDAKKSAVTYFCLVLFMLAFTVQCAAFRFSISLHSFCKFETVVWEEKRPGHIVFWSRKCNKSCL